MVMISTKQPRISEGAEQRAFIEYVLLKYQHRQDFIRKLFFSTLAGAWLAEGANPRARGRLIAKYKAEGWVNGVCDILYLQPRGEYAYLAIEMKALDRRGEKAGGLSPDQQEWLQMALGAGARCAVCYGSGEAEQAFDAYMDLEVPNG